MAVTRTGIEAAADASPESLAPGVMRGQRGDLRLTFEAVNGRSVLTQRYASAPFGSVRAAYPDDTGIPEVQITNPSGGLLGGDRLELDVTLLPGSSATLATQGASKAYRGEESRQTSRFRLGDGSYLEYVPHHLIPYSGASHRQTSRFMLQGDATLLAWEAYAAGRLARGERFDFDRLSADTRLFVEDEPVVSDGFELPGMFPPDGECFGGYPYLATVLAVLPGADGLSESLHTLLKEDPRTLASSSTPSERLCVSRILARSAPVLYRALGFCRESVRESLGLPAGRGIW